MPHNSQNQSENIIPNNSNNLAYLQGQIDAINKSQAVIEFDINGIILNANENFLKTLKYSLDEIKGRYHSLFCDESYVNSEDYAYFWSKLKKGQFQNGQFKRYTKYGQAIWIQATYCPILDDNNQVIKIVKFAHNITKEKELSLYYEGQIEAISKSQAVIEFNPNGIVLNANENFLKTLGYSLDEIQGQPHSIFCEDEFVRSDEYTKDGLMIWIQASYNPIYGIDGKVAKIVKFAHNITKEKELSLYNEGQISAISKSQAVIEFDKNGVVLTANENFLQTLDYNIEQIKGKHHSMFCEKDYVDTPEYKDFWRTLKQGEYHQGEYKRLNRQGEIIWIQATYNPIYGIDGKVMKIVKFAHNITKQKSISLYHEGQLEAISKSQAVIEFDINGVIITANNNFLNALGYTLEDVQGKHHSMFCPRLYTTSNEYKEFWDMLKKGQYHSGQYKRIHKDGKIIWIRATYNPIFGIDGKIIRVVKFAHDITADQRRSLFNKGKIDAISKSQAVIEFDRDGYILNANQNFLQALKYNNLDEIRGKHHSIFCDEKFAKSDEYKKAWRELQNGKFHVGDR